VLVHIEEYIPSSLGLCLMYALMKSDGLITEKEYDKLYFYTLEHRPERFDGFSGFFWTMGEIKPRREFIENLISKL
jgi:hypothetical protein